MYNFLNCATNTSPITNIIVSSLFCLQRQVYFNHMRCRWLPKLLSEIPQKESKARKVVTEDLMPAKCVVGSTRLQKYAPRDVISFMCYGIDEVN